MARFRVRKIARTPSATPDGHLLTTKFCHLVLINGQVQQENKFPFQLVYKKFTDKS